MLDHHAAVHGVGMRDSPDAGLRLGQAACGRSVFRRLGEVASRGGDVQTSVLDVEPPGRKTNIENTPFWSDARSTLAESSSESNLKGLTFVPSSLM